MAKKAFSKMTAKERRSALGGSASVLSRRKKKNVEIKKQGCDLSGCNCTK